MWFTLREYLEPTPSLHELRMLTHLSRHPVTAQAQLARMIGLTPAMVNAYLRRFTEAGLLQRIPVNGRGLEYRLTPEGERRRSYHTISCLAELYRLFEELVADLRARLMAGCGADATRVVFYGAGETGQMAYLALRDLPHVAVVGVVDDDPDKIGHDFHEHRIETPDAIRRLRPDRVLVTSWSHSDPIVRKLQDLLADQEIAITTLTP